MSEVILTGRKVSRGKAAGEALVTVQALSFLGGIDPETGRVVEAGHELEGACISGKILVFPGEKGSTMGSYRLYEMARRGTHPRGIINCRAGPVIAVGAIISNIPMVDRLDKDPTTVVATGDYVEIDADNGTVKVKKMAGGLRERGQG